MCKDYCWITETDFDELYDALDYIEENIAINGDAIAIRLLEKRNHFVVAVLMKYGNW